MTKLNNIDVNIDVNIDSYQYQYLYCISLNTDGNVYAY